jgi:ketosteroid isomerase-like protein
MPDATPVQQRDGAATVSWLNQYYDDYSAMSAAPAGPAMDKWLGHYAPFAFFEDPTLGQSGMGHEQIRKPFVDAFTGPLGPVRWILVRRVTDGEWSAVEGWLEGSQTGKPFRTRFSTWFKVRDGKIAHQIDYMDYGAMRRQVGGEETPPREGDGGSSAAGRSARDSAHAIRVADEFYARYEAMPVLASEAGVARFVDLMTEDFRLEDPTGRLLYDSRARMHAILKAAVAAGDFTGIHWDVNRRITDGEWVASEGFFRGVFRKVPFATRFTMWLQVRGGNVARQIDYIDYPTFRKLTLGKQ